MIQRYVKHWIEPNVDISKWEYFDLSCAKRDATNDQGDADLVALLNRFAL
jgi:hypothetical protein